MTTSPLPVLPDLRLLAGAARLAARHRGRFGIETVQGLLADSYTRLAATAHVRAHLVVLAERLATERLDALAHTRTPAPGSPVRVLFVCSANAGRSQLAAALLTHRADGRAVAHSAGTAPTGVVDPGVAAVLAETGLDPVEAFPKPVTDEVIAAADYVITLGCHDACPVIPGRTYADWPVPDPDGAPLPTVRAISDQLDAHITDLLATLPTR